MKTFENLEVGDELGDEDEDVLTIRAIYKDNYLMSYMIDDFERTLVYKLDNLQRQCTIIQPKPDLNQVIAEWCADECENTYFVISESSKKRLEDKLSEAFNI